MLAFQAGGAARFKLICSRTITPVINTAGKLVAKNESYVGGLGVEMIGLS